MTRDELTRLDAVDPLAGFRARFSLPDGVIYLDGNSLGPLPAATPGRIAEVIGDEWGQGLIRSWNDAGWIDRAGRVGNKIGRLIGAAPQSVMVADSTSVNLFKLLSAALRMRPERRVILSEAGNFPTDLYIAEGLADLLGRGHELRCVAPDEIVTHLQPDVAVVMLTEVNYHTGRRMALRGRRSAPRRSSRSPRWRLELIWRWRPIWPWCGRSRCVWARYSRR